jgi:hypothetical protein
MLNFRVVFVFNVTFNNISVISWQSGLLVEETEVPGEDHRPANCFIVYNLFYCLQWNYYTNVYIHGLASHQQPNHNIVHVLNELWGDRIEHVYCKLKTNQVLF